MEACNGDGELLGTVGIDKARSDFECQLLILLQGAVDVGRVFLDVKRFDRQVRRIGNRLHSHGDGRGGAGFVVGEVLFVIAIAGGHALFGRRDNRQVERAGEVQTRGNGETRQVRRIKQPVAARQFGACGKRCIGRHALNNHRLDGFRTVGIGYGCGNVQRNGGVFIAIRIACSQVRHVSHGIHENIRGGADGDGLARDNVGHGGGDGEAGQIFVAVFRREERRRAAKALARVQRNRPRARRRVIGTAGSRHVDFPAVIDTADGDGDLFVAVVRRCGNGNRGAADRVFFHIRILNAQVRINVGAERRIGATVGRLILQSRRVDFTDFIERVELRVLEIRLEAETVTRTGRAAFTSGGFDVVQLCGRSKNVAEIADGQLCAVFQGDFNAAAFHRAVVGDDNLATVFKRDDQLAAVVFDGFRLVHREAESIISAFLKLDDQRLARFRHVDGFGIRQGFFNRRSFSGGRGFHRLQRSQVDFLAIGEAEGRCGGHRCDVGEVFDNQRRAV